MGTLIGGTRILIGGTLIGPIVGIFNGGQYIWGLLSEQTTKSPSVRRVSGLILLSPHCD